MASATFYCCKGTSGDATGEEHSAPVTDATAPFGIAVDMSKFTTTGTRELYVDYRDTSGVMHEENYANFTVNVTPPVVPTTANVTITWEAPTKRTDGSALASADLASFDLLYFDDATGTMRTMRITDPASRSVKVTNLPKNTSYHFSVTATDTKGSTSAASQAVDLQL
jgi:hypothetical protein